MNIINLFRTHKHYWTMPRKRPGGVNVQTCYGCSHERTVTMNYGSQISDASNEAMVLNALYQPMLLDTITIRPASHL